MSEYPDGWFRDGAGAAPAGQGSADPAAHLPGGVRPAGQGAGGQERPASAWPAQPPASSRSPGAGAGRTGYAGAPGAGTGLDGGRGAAGLAAADLPGAGGAGGFPGIGGGRRWLRPRRILAVLAVLVSVVLILVVGMYFFLNSKLDRKNVLVSYAGRPAASAGQNWLIAGSDSRQGLSRKEEDKLATGHDISGQRSDTIMILHVPSNGGPSVLISLPRDSYVPIPGDGENKLNAAYSLGGPTLLAKTVQNITGLRINHYMGIGFGGFVNVVNAVGGVRMCIKRRLDDPAAGLHLRKGCQTLNGAKALGYVRTRHLYGDQDLQRVQDQRLFMRALLSKMTSPGVILNPFAAIPAATGAADTLTVDTGTSLYQLIEVAFSLRHPETTTVPIANSNYPTSAGDAVLWDTAAARQLFTALRNDQPVPRRLITGSHQAS
jgi:LCP family protein required for cell wall assembly